MTKEDVVAYEKEIRNKAKWKELEKLCDVFFDLLQEGKIYSEGGSIKSLYSDHPSIEAERLAKGKKTKKNHFTSGPVSPTLVTG